MAKRIGLTMRVTHADSYAETRDALANDWAAMMYRYLPELLWLALPNLGESIKDYIEQWELDGFILTGGNDIGTAPERDITETVILRYALNKDFPVVGVCRGLQMMQHFYDSPVAPCASEDHLARNHSATILKALPGGLVPGSIISVNSFHQQCVGIEQLSEDLEALCISEDGCVEALRGRNKKLFGVQWHPERPGNNPIIDKTLLRYWFDLEQ